MTRRTNGHEQRAVALCGVLALRFGAGGAVVAEEESYMNSLKQILRPRHFEYARLVSQAYDNRQIAQQLGVSYSYVKTELFRIYERVGCSQAPTRAHSHTMIPRVELAVRFAVEEANGLYREAA
jgi:DNA-binding NarL/FixJ family response regulator